jgi:hypothetical protein
MSGLAREPVLGMRDRRYAPVGGIAMPGQSVDRSRKGRGMYRHAENITLPAPRHATDAVPEACKFAMTFEEKSNFKTCSGGRHLHGGIEGLKGYLECKAVYLHD